MKQSSDSPKEDWPPDVTTIATRPLAVNNLFHAGTKIRGLFAYGLFNPLGPTVCVLTRVRFRSYKPDALYFRMLNPFKQENWVLGLIASDASPGEIEALILEILKNGGLGKARVVGRLPSWIVAPKEDHLRLAERCFAAHISAHDRLPEVRKNLGALRAYEGRPWERVEADWKKECPEVQDGTFAEWFSRITDEKYLGVETFTTFLGWDASIEFVGAPPEKVFRSERVVNYLQDCGFNLRSRWEPIFKREAGQ